MMDFAPASARVAAGITVAASAAFAMCISGFPATARAAVPADVTVKSFQYMPGEIVVSPGTTVRWTNQDQILHTATSGVPGAPDGRFDGPMDGVGSTFSFQFQEAGTYAYYCSRHESMTGRVVVN